MIFRMLRETIGRENFDRLLATYFDTYRGKNASIDDFEKLAAKISQENLRYFFAQWVEGTGVPEFTVDYQIIRTLGQVPHARHRETEPRVAAHAG